MRLNKVSSSFLFCLLMILALIAEKYFTNTALNFKTIGICIISGLIGGLVYWLTISFYKKKKESSGK